MRALAIAFVLSIASPAAAQLDLALPDCAPTHIDVALLRELLAIELGDAPLTMTLGATLCDARARDVDVDVRLPSGPSVHEVIELAASDDPHEAARAAALAIAERVPHMRAALTPPAEPTPPTPEPIADPALALGSPLAPATPPPPPRAPALRLPPTFGVGLRGRLLPVLPSWALGLRLELGANFDPTWSLRGEVFSTWTRATAQEGDIDAVVLAGALMLGASVFRESNVDLVVGARAEAGALVALGWSSGASVTTPTTHAWLTAGGELDLIVWLDPSIAFVADVGVSAVVLGTRLLSWPSGTQIDYSVLTLDVGTSLRFAL